MSREYDEYLDMHIADVQRAAQWMVLHMHDELGLDGDEERELLDNVRHHDESKRAPEEYDAYDAYFYGERDDDAFNRAWLHHIHNNPHHWQHWLLVNDDEECRGSNVVVPLEMPKVYVVEMVADWWSFSWKSGNLNEIFDWYEDHADLIILGKRTKMYLNALLTAIYGRLHS